MADATSVICRNPLVRHYWLPRAIRDSVIFHLSLKKTSSCPMFGPNLHNTTHSFPSSNCERRRKWRYEMTMVWNKSTPGGKICIPLSFAYLRSIEFLKARKQFVVKIIPKFRRKQCSRIQYHGNLCERESFSSYKIPYSDKVCSTKSIEISWLNRLQIDQHLVDSNA